MDIIIKVLQFFLCFTILVGIHEFGHFIVARMFKIRVEKFYIFFDPWFSLFKYKRGETEYGLGWLPLGGYCKIGGMIDESMDTEQMAQPARPDDFRSKPAWQRLLVMLAGVFMNVVLAVTIYCGISYTWGESYLSNEEIKWGYNFNQAGHALGFVDGDRIMAIDGEKTDNIVKIVNDLLLTESGRKVTVLRDGQTLDLHLSLEELIEMRRNKGYENLLLPRIPFIIDSAVLPTAQNLFQKGDEVLQIDDLHNGDFPTYQQYLKSHPEQVVTMKILRGVDTLQLQAPISKEGALGVQVLQAPFKLRTQHYTFWESIPAGFRKTGKVISSYWDQLKLIVQPKTKMYEELGGFIAIGQIFSNEWNWQDFWMKSAFLSIILAVMNLLPIPGLDGGHAIFTFWEVLTRRKVSDKVLEIAQYIGMFIILFLLLYANGNDIYRFFIK